MMAPNERIVAEEFDKQHTKAHLAVEDSFSQQVTKFPHSDNLQSHKVTQGGLSNWKYLRCLWDLQTLFFNLFTCSAGSQVTGALGVPPPSVHGYLYSCNNNLLNMSRWRKPRKSLMQITISTINLGLIVYINFSSMKKYSFHLHILATGHTKPAFFSLLITKL
jgi:hypothetical protein